MKLNLMESYNIIENADFFFNTEKFTNLAIFIPHKGCPHTCSFCNQRIITGSGEKDDEEAEIAGFRSTIESQIPFLIKHGYKAEIAFFGGTFTAIDRNYMIDLLKLAVFYVEQYPHIFIGIRCSTRPDAISEDILEILKTYKVTAIELGAQSMNDDVLIFNNRGHTAADTIKAAVLIKKHGFKLGLQMMVGLYKDTAELSFFTANEFIKLYPDCVRIYPTVVMPDTILAKLFENKLYEPIAYEKMLDLCALLYGMFLRNNIPVTRIGLDTSSYIEEKMLAGFYHPAMGELCQSRYFYYRMLEIMKKSGENQFVIETDKRFVSKINGHKKENKEKLKSLNFSYVIIEKPNQTPNILIS